jgi:hypothetical protein
MNNKFKGRWRKHRVETWNRNLRIRNKSAYHSPNCQVHHPPFCFSTITRCGSRVSVVGIATGYGLDDRGVGVRVPEWVKNFLFSTSSRPALGSIQPHIQWVLVALSLGVKRPEREVDQLPPTSADVKSIWIYTTTPPYALMMKCLIS